MKRFLWNTASSFALGGLCAWGVDDGLRVVDIDMPMTGLGKDLAGLKIVQISDLHSSLLVLDGYLHRCVELVNSLQPDIVALTGDFITGLWHFARGVGEVLSGLRPALASLVVLGNHDYGLWRPGTEGVAGLGDFLVRQLERSGILVLRNQSCVLQRGQGSLQFVGVEDMWSQYFDPAKAFASARPDLPTVALCHNPMGAQEMIDRGAQWVLSGHTHGRGGLGNKLHEIIRPAPNRHLMAGLYRLDGGHVYVNTGLGHARRNHPTRHAEITAFTLRCR